MIKILHVSDLHFGPPFLENVAAALRREAFEHDPDLIVASGDFTQSATAGEFAQARDFLRSLPPKPMATTPGNHDVPFLAPLRGIDPFGRYKEHLNPLLDEFLRVGDIWCACLNSTSRWGSLLDGYVRNHQLEKCRRFFADSPEGALRIVVAHHHFVAPPDIEGRGAMRGARRALDRFTEMGVDLILGGHKHRGYIGNSLDFYSGKDRRQGAIVVQCGTSTSCRGRYREKEKNTYNEITHDREEVRIRHFMFFHDAGGFRPISEHTFARGELDTKEVKVENKEVKVESK
ncbi:MAG TPA: metallophosphoesterase family protein [Planctomycetia bacterium]|nr:metallophosphoesterase family protein [Planctomycetia bacterium]